MCGGTFRVYFTRHRYLPPNSALLSVHAASAWHGQMLVIRQNETGTENANLKRGDIPRINKLVSRSGS
ncbi:hypothetical protein OH77DRAFT_1225830 [Trametes cingulata]|nr:hypothetical protein OH77DRAFT_1225830 [Trametes cingulata]